MVSLSKIPLLFPARRPPVPHGPTLPPITEIAKGPQPTRGAVEEYRDTLAVSSRENGQAARLALHFADTGEPDQTALATPFADPRPEARQTLPPIAPREVIPRDPAPEPRITLTL